MPRASGFTLIELTMTITILGIMAVGVTSFFGATVGGYGTTVVRAQMASAMVVAGERISRDIRRALPNSVRIGGVLDNCVEFVPVKRGGFYVSVPRSVSAASFAAASLGNTTSLSGHVAVYPTDVSSIYDTSALPGVVTPDEATVPVGSDEVTIALGAAHRFPADSPQRRFYVTDSPQAYCQPSGSSRLYRYRDYGFNATASLPPSGGTRDVLIDGLSTASTVDFDYTSGSLQRHAVLRFVLVASGGEESMTLDQEVQVRNVP